MNPIVLFSIGLLMAAMGILFSIPAIIDISNHNPDWKAFAESSAIAVFIGISLMLLTWGRTFCLGRRDGYLLTIGSWVAMSLVAALPFWFSSHEISFTNAVFESISGLTTTGSTTFTHLGSMPPGFLLWRAMLQWIGGIGIIVMAVSLLPFLRVGGMQLYRMETSDQYDKITPRIADVCLRIFGIYVLLSLACVITYWSLGMTIFEALIHAMTTISTGGFSTSDQSLGYFKAPAIEWAAVVFMLAGSLPFTVYIRFLHSPNRTAFTLDSQTLPFMTYTIVTICLGAIYLEMHQPSAILDSLRISAFSVVSIITTTGYASGDYLGWGAGAATFFFFLTLIGGCAGSTSGGLKAFRLLALYKGIRNQSQLLQFPNSLYQMKLGDRDLTKESMTSVYLFFLVMISSLGLITLALSMTGLDFISSISAAATSIANVGPGLGTIIGPTGTFAPLSNAAKWILDVGMLIGRLEYFTVLVLFLPNFWKE
ncbi:MAG: TrkH family potassium uptake protein [Magnetovibrio sp.]|nr:TrkH family potassium uptake protein [Magnetovibrio sp.]